MELKFRVSYGAPMKNVEMETILPKRCIPAEVKRESIHVKTGTVINDNYRKHNEQDVRISNEES